MSNVASLAIEQCLLSGVAKIFSSATVRDMEDDELQAIAAESDETMQERARLSDRVKTLEKGLGILRFHPGEYETGSSPGGSIAVAREYRLIYSDTASRKQRAMPKPATEAKTVAPSGTPRQASTSGTQPTAPAANLFGSLGTSNVFNTSNAPSPGTGRLFGQATFAKPASSTKSSNSPSVFASTSPFSNLTGPSNLFGNSATGNSPFGSPLANNTGGTSNTQPFSLLNSNRTTSTMSGGNTPKGTPSLFIPYIDDTPSGKECFENVTALPAYRNMSLEVGLLRYTREAIDAKYLQELRLQDYALGHKRIV